MVASYGEISFYLDYQVSERTVLFHQAMWRGKGKREDDDQKQQKEVHVCMTHRDAVFLHEMF